MLLLETFTLKHIDNFFTVQTWPDTLNKLPTFHSHPSLRKEGSGMLLALVKTTEMLMLMVRRLNSCRKETFTNLESLQNSHSSEA